MSVQSSINNMLAGFGYLSGQNAQARREKRMLKIETRLANESLAEAKTERKNAIRANTRAVNKLNKMAGEGVDPLTTPYRKQVNRSVEATNRYGQSFRDYQRAMGRYEEAVSNYSRSIVGKSNKRALADIAKAKEAEEVLEGTIPAGENVIQNLDKIQEAYMNEPEIPEEFLDSIDMAGMKAYTNLYNTTSQAMNQNEALKERFGYKRNG